MESLVKAAESVEGAGMMGAVPPWPPNMRKPKKNDRIVVVHGECPCNLSSLIAEVKEEVNDDNNYFSAFAYCPVAPFKDLYTWTEDDWSFDSNKRHAEPPELLKKKMKSMTKSCVPCATSVPARDPPAAAAPAPEAAAEVRIAVEFAAFVLRVQPVSHVRSIPLHPLDSTSECCVRRIKLTTIR